MPDGVSAREKLEQLEEAQRATLNILEDFDAEKAQLQGSQRALLNILEDIEVEKTKVQEAGQALRASEERTRLIVDRAHDAFIAMDVGGVITDWNPQAERIFGWSRAEALGCRLAETIIPGQYREAHFRGLQHFLATGEGPVLNKRLELTALHRDGHEFPVELSITPLRTGDRWIFAAFLRDITEKKRAEDALRESDERHRLLFASSPQPMWVFEWKTLSFLAVNEAAVRHYGYSREEFLSMTIGDIRPPEEVPALRAHLSAAHTGTEDGETWKHKKKDGPVIDVEIHSQRILFGGREASLVLVNDITERKRTQARLQEVNTELAAANKELEAFTYSVSHDLRAPLRHIDGFARLLMEEHAPNLSDQARHYLERVRDGAQQMGQLVDDLLNLSRIGRQELRRQVTGLKSLVEETRQELKPELGGREVEWRIGELPFVECDPALMKQVFVNLLSNAVKFTRPRKAAVIEVGQAVQKGQPAVFVRDNGVGFSMKYADKLFGVFQRLHRPEDFEGTGVGLATVERIIHKHGGRVWAEAELDKGATFYFTLQGEPSGQALQGEPSGQALGAEGASAGGDNSMATGGTR